MTQEELQAMPRKEWRAYCKRMKETAMVSYAVIPLPPTGTALRR